MYQPMSELLNRAVAGGYAVPAFCSWNAEIIAAVLRQAERLDAPVIVMAGPCEFGLLPPARMAAVARAMKSCYPRAVAALHLDHGSSMEEVCACLDAGYTSVMLDYSARSYAENAAALKQVTVLARASGATVEGEIGHVGKVETTAVEGAGASSLTVPEEAFGYARETGVDALAVSIGNAHGQYTRLPRLDFERLAAIHALVDLPLVLHGGSGTPEADLHRAIALGIAKVNVATELVAAWRDSLRSQWEAQRNLWAPMAQAEAVQAVERVIEKWIRLCLAAGRAS
jgi:ketose-bisphosphate aldolase